MSLPPFHSKSFYLQLANDPVISEYIFPINQNFSTFKPKSKLQYFFDKSKYQTVTFSNNTPLQFPHTYRSQRVETLVQNLAVSQIQAQQQVQQKLQRTFYGVQPHKTAIKNLTLYRKKFTSLEVSNVSELNITSYKNFKIRSRKIKSKGKSRPQKSIQLHNKQENIKQELKKDTANVLLQGKQSKKSSLPRLQQVLYLKNRSMQSNIKWQTKTIWQRSARVQKASYFTPQQLTEQKQSSVRKNSICAWEQAESMP